MSWAKMPRLERKTEIRGRSAVPCAFERTRRRRLRRRVGAVSKVMRVGSPWWSVARRRGRNDCRSRPLTALSHGVLAVVADALALVGLGRAVLADDRGDLA